MQPNLTLKVAIAASGLRQRWIAATTGIPENRLSTIVNGWAEPRQTEREAIAATLGKSAEELFDRERQQAPAA